MKIERTHTTKSIEDSFEKLRRNQKVWELVYRDFVAGKDDFTIAVNRGIHISKVSELRNEYAIINPRHYGQS